ncbi:MAG: hypothetical protein ACFFCM_00325 [Promethearchaeota archaeon]
MSNKTLLIPRGLEIRWNKMRQVINSNILCLEALLQALEENMLIRNTFSETYKIYLALFDFLQSGLRYNQELVEYERMCNLVNELQNISYRPYLFSSSIGITETENSRLEKLKYKFQELNTDLLSIGRQLLLLLKNDDKFNDYFKNPEIIERYRTHGPMLTAKYIKKKYGSAGICSIIDPWRKYLVDNFEVNWWYFEKIRAKIKFQNKKNRRMVIAANSNIRIDDELLQIRSRKMIRALKQKRFRNKFQNDNIPVFNEENINQIREVATKYKIELPKIININFNLKKITLLGFNIESIEGSKETNLAFQINSTQGLIDVILEKHAGSIFYRPNKIIEISKLIGKYSNLPIIGRKNVDTLLSMIDIIFLRNKIDITDEFEYWIKALESSDIEFREEAIISLGELGDKRALPFLEKLLKKGLKPIQDLLKKAIDSIKNFKPN